jgi:signal transduction histidine kinase
MVAVVAHELRNPLMIIRASAERVRKKSDIPEAGFVLEEVDRLNDIVTGYLDFARSGGRLLSSVTATRIDIAELLGNVRTHLSEKYSGEAIAWLGKCPEGLSLVGYYRSLRQVLLNLLINGVESCRDVGKPVEVGIVARESGSSVELRILDHGRGLTSRELKKVFTPFYTTRQAGSGLGLYLSRRLVEEMGGQLTMTSEPDKGTEVTLLLPAERETQNTTTD